jgi:hypothetical protein
MFDLRVRERDSVSGAVLSVVCRFSIIFGREELSGAKRKAMGCIMYFETFQTDHYIRNITPEHSQQWSACVELDGPQEHDDFFNAVDAS